MTKQFEKNSKVLIGDVLSPVPKQKKIKKSEYQETGLIPVIDQGSDFIAGYTDDLDRAYRGKLPVIVFGDHTRVLKFVSFRFSAGADGTQVLRPIQKFDERYFYYSLGALNLKNYGYERHFKYLKEEKIIFRPLPIQRKIAGILSAYDDLIENNTRRIQILEEMAQRIYREWFVHFRYTGHENDKLAESDLGMIPEGWEIKRLKEFGEVITGKTPSKKKPEYYGSDIPFIKTPDMHGNIFCLSTGEYLSTLGAETQSKKTLPPDTLCVSCIGTAGIVSITAVPSQTNQQINSLVTKSNLIREFLYFALLDLKETIKLHGTTGATMANLSKGKFESLKVVTAPDEIISKYHDITESIFDDIKMLQYTNINLQKTRDLLLPKLISGKIDVTELDIDIGEMNESLQ